jgi:hypothetical protein
VKVEEIIEQVLIDAVCLNGFDPFDEEERKELAAEIVKALRKEFHIVPYAGQISFE